MSITLLGAAPLTLERRGPTTYSSGLPVLATPVDVLVTASVFVKAGTTATPSGDLIAYDAQVISYSEIRVADEVTGAPADRFTHLGQTYELQFITARQPPFMGQPEHWEASALEVAAHPMPEG